MKDYEDNKCPCMQKGRHQKNIFDPITGECKFCGRTPGCSRIARLQEEAANAN